MLTSLLYRFFFTLPVLLLLPACQSERGDQSAKSPEPASSGADVFRLRATFQLPDSAYTLAVADLNNDGFPELLTASNTGLLLWKNQRTFTFRQQRLRDTACALNVMDFDNDSYLDIFSPPMLLLNRRDFTFTDSLLSTFRHVCPSEPYFMDINQDGTPDVVAGTQSWVQHKGAFVMKKNERTPGKAGYRLSILLKASPDRMALAPAAKGAPFLHALGDSMTQLVPADLDRDGDPDMLSLHAGKNLKIWENRSLPQSRRHYIKLRLIGAYPNYYGIGAKVRVRQNGQAYELENQPRSSMGIREPVLYIGLGKKEILDYLTICWPDGRTQEFQALHADQELTVSQTHAKEPKLNPDE